MTIEVHELTLDRRDLLAADAIVRAEAERQYNPDDPPAPVDELAAELAGRTSQKYVRAWLATVDGEPAGDVWFELETSTENGHIADADGPVVRAGFPGEEVADALLCVALDVLGADGRTSLLAWAPALDDGVRGARARRLGLDVGIEERCSRLRMGDLDVGLVDRWIAEGAARTDGYRLVRIGARCPDELVAAYLEATAAMDDMPTDSLEWKVARTDEELLRTREDDWQHKGLTVVRCLAVAPDGRGAGMTELFVNGHRPVLAHQGDTGVAAGHRGRGLGRWLKAENLRFAQELSPGFEVVETYNAQSNPWMLDINVAMGFRPHVIWRGYQGDLAAARAVVGAGV